MAKKIQPYTVQDGDTEYTVYIEVDDTEPVGGPMRTYTGPTDEDESYGFGPSRGVSSPAEFVQLHEINQTIRNYARFVIGAFKNLGGAEVQELNFKFGIKMGGTARVPVLTECSTEGNFEIEVKCTFPKEQNSDGEKR